MNADIQALPVEEQIKALMAENERLKRAAKSGKNGLKVSEKGAVSLYGMGRFPITLYAESWIKVLDKAQEIREFIEANKSSLKFKEA